MSLVHDPANFDLLTQENLTLQQQLAQAQSDLATLAEQAIARAEKAEADLAEVEHDLVEGISYIRQTSRYVNDDRDCRAAWSWADDLQQRHDARVNARYRAGEGK